VYLMNPSCFNAENKEERQRMIKVKSYTLAVFPVKFFEKALLLFPEWRHGPCASDRAINTNDARISIGRWVAEGISRRQV
jgi:hypothetical protein